MHQLITLGETMAAFTPDGTGPLRYIRDYRLRFAGAESNTAIDAARLGISTCWISRLGADEFGRFILNQIRGEGVDCSHVISDPDHPTGLMFKETLGGQTHVTYYRAGSAASALSPSDLNESLFRDASLLHLTGITPVLSDSCRNTVLEAFRLAEKYRVPVSFDPNIRRKLWKDRDYTELIRELTLRSQIVLTGLDEAEALFGTQDTEEILDILFNRGVALCVAIKNGEKGAVVSGGKQLFRLLPHPCRCVESVGAGDAFNAGFLAGLLKGRDLETAGRMGCICGALATQTPGDTEGCPDEKQLDQILENEAPIYR